MTYPLTKQIYTGRFYPLQKARPGNPGQYQHFQKNLLKKGPKQAGRRIPEKWKRSPIQARIGFFHQNKGVRPPYVKKGDLISCSPTMKQGRTGVSRVPLPVVPGPVRPDFDDPVVEDPEVLPGPPRREKPELAGIGTVQWNPAKTQEVQPVFCSTILRVIRCDRVLRTRTKIVRPAQKRMNWSRASLRRSRSITFPRAAAFFIACRIASCGSGPRVMPGTPGAGRAPQALWLCP